jgi:hypothetical protein
MNLKSGRIEGFEGYSHFNSLKDLYTHVEVWLAVKIKKFSKEALVGCKPHRYVLGNGEIITMIGWTRRISFGR